MTKQHPQRDELLSILKQMRCKYGEYACEVCDKADEIIAKVESEK